MAADSGDAGAWQADWDSNRRRKLTRGLEATPAQRLAWLEAAIRLAYASGALPRQRDDAASSVEKTRR
jgi:hypothetical protein